MITLTKQHTKTAKHCSLLSYPQSLLDAHWDDILQYHEFLEHLENYKCSTSYSQVVCVPYVYTTKFKQHLMFTLRLAWQHPIPRQTTSCLSTLPSDSYQNLFSNAGTRLSPRTRCSRRSTPENATNHVADGCFPSFSTKKKKKSEKGKRNRGTCHHYPN